MTGTEPHAWGTGLMDDITFVGLDVHKATVCIAIAQGSRGGEVRQLGVFENRPEILGKVVSCSTSLDRFFAWFSVLRPAMGNHYALCPWHSSRQRA